MALIDNLVSYWKLEESSATRVDSHGTNDLASTAGVSGATGKLGNAALFDGETGYLYKADNADLSTGDIDFTLQAWFYLSATGQWHSLITKGSGGGAEYSLFVTPADKMRFEVVDGSGSATNVDDTTTLTAGTWYLAHAWHDAANNLIGVALNAGSATTGSWTTGVRDGANEFRLGARSTNDLYLNGKLDAVGLWKRVLSSTERSQLYNAGAGLEYPFVAGGRWCGRPRRAIHEPSFEYVW